MFAALGLVVGASTLLATYLLVERSIALQTVDLDPAAVGPTASDEQIERSKARAAEAERSLRQQLRAGTLDPLVDRGLVLVAGFTVASLAVGWFAAGTTLRPLRPIIATARRVADGNLRERVPVAEDNGEWKELTVAINDMLSRLDATFAAQRQFVGNASHELKTPLAINQTLLEVAMARPDASPDLVRLGETMLAVNARHERLVDGLLALVRAEHGVADPRPVDVAEVVEGGLVLSRPEAERLRLRLDAEARPVTVSGDRLLLDRLVQNLLQNAIRHNVAGGWLRLTAGPIDGAARLTVTNSGPVIAPSSVPALFEPFARATNRVHSARGSGLGLSIVRSVAQAHGGTVTASARAEGGLDVVVTIPAATRQNHDDLAPRARPALTHDHDSDGQFP